jgi:RecB family exonuclease
VVAHFLERYAQIRPKPDVEAPAERPPLELSFSHLHDFEICPVRFRFSKVWGVPAPPDDLLNRAARAAGSAELGSAVHATLAAWHTTGGEVVSLYNGPEAGRAMLARYVDQPLSKAATLGVEVEFNLTLAGARVRGLVDRIAEVDGRTVLIDYKTNATLDAKLLEAYKLQLRLYGLAARRGLLPGGTSPRLVLFDLRRGVEIEVEPDDAGVVSRVANAVARITAGDFSLGPEHAERPCYLCAYRPICKDARDTRTS